MSGKPFADPLTLVDRLRAINLEAADEIERLRADFAGLKRELAGRVAS